MRPQRMPIVEEGVDVLADRSPNTYSERTP